MTPVDETEIENGSEPDTSAETLQAIGKYDSGGAAELTVEGTGEVFVRGITAWTRLFEGISPAQSAERSLVAKPSELSEVEFRWPR